MKIKIILKLNIQVKNVIFIHNILKEIFLILVGICQKGICSGRPSGAECKEHIDCNKGLFCNGLYCHFV